MKIRKVRTVRDTNANVQEIARAFREAAESEYQGSGARKFADKAMGGKTGSKFGFFTPDAGDDPFAQLEEQPDFSVGVKMPAGGFVSGAQPVTVHLYVVDNGSSRHVELVGLYAQRALRVRTEELVSNLAASLPG